MSTLPFTNFTKGELAPELQARIDTSQYAAGAKRVRNFIIQRYGGLSFRPGFRLVAEADDVDEVIKYIPFQYNIEQAYIMSLGDERMRLMTAGGVVLEQNLEIVSLTNAANAQVEIPFHEYEVGDRIYFYNVVGMDEINGRDALVVSVQDADNFTIDLDTTNFGVFVSSDGDTRSGPPAPPPVPPPEPPPPAPTPPPDPPPTTGGGGTGGGIGDLPRQGGGLEQF
jgi:hypothetical protein